MAEETKNQSVGEALGQMPASGGKRKGLIWLSMLGGVVVLASVAGFSVGRGLHGEEPKEESAATEKAGEPERHEVPNEDYTYYEFESIAVSLNEHRMDRYLRVSIVLAMKTKDGAAATEMVNKKKPELKSWLTVFLSGCSLDDVRGDKNLNRLRREIQDSLNAQLWGDSRPLIDHVLFKDIAVQ
jgi:flagellar basal body-associated protein FliL